MKLYTSLDASRSFALRAAVLEVIRDAELFKSPETLTIRLTLGDAWIQRITRIFESAIAFDPRNASTYRWWIEHFHGSELHHTWPKWMRGRVKQTSELYLPRCVHNMAGDELGQVAIHHKINELFEAAFGARIVVEDSKEFDKYYKALDTEDKKRTFLDDVRELLLEAYTIVIDDSVIVSRIAQELADELEELAP